MTTLTDRFLGGRINRITYLVALILVGIVLLLDQVLIASDPSLDQFIGLFYLLVVSPIALSVIARRAHDLGRSGWLILLLQLIPVINFGVALVLIVKRGQHSPNQYGSIPESGVNWRAIVTPWRAISPVAPEPPVDPPPPYPIQSVGQSTNGQ